MKKRFRDINENKFIELVDTPDLKLFLEGLNYLKEQFVQGKLFFNHEKIKQYKESITKFLGKSVVFYRNEMIQKYVAQYNEFSSLISTKLYQIEKEFTQQNIFTKEKMAHPMENVKKAVLFYNESTGVELMSKFGQLGGDLLEIIKNVKDSGASSSEGTSLLKAALKFLKEKDSSAFGLLQDLIKNRGKYPEKEKPNEIINEMHSLSELQLSSLERLKKNRAESVKAFLIAIQDTQSHIEYFCKYFHRLVHIKKYGNRKYGEEYYDYNSKRFEEESFINMCKIELKDFPELQNFLKRYCTTFKELRNIRAHQVAGEVKISPSGFISIPAIGKEKGKDIDYKEKREKMIDYGVFINKIKFHPYSPYDEAEDVFIVT